MNELEKIIIACIIKKPKLLNELVLAEEHFKTDICRIIIRLFKAQYSKLKTIDIRLLDYAEFNLTESQKQEIIKYIVEAMQEELVIISNFYYYQEELFRNFISESILNEINKFYNKKISQELLLEKIHNLEKSSLKTKDSVLTKEEIYQIISKKNENINFRFHTLSKESNIQQHDFVVISARPGIGKTGFALNLIEDLSDKYKCLYFNMEMSEKQVFQRLVSINTAIPMKCFMNIQTDYQNEKILDGCKRIANKKISCFTGTQTVRSIKQKIIEESKSGHVLAFIDYVGLIVGQPKVSSYERTTEIVKELRQVSLEYDCTIFLIAQINRNAERDKDKKPRISDLKDTGELEQSATTVIMLHNENYYNNTGSDKDIIQLIIGKNRNGTTGICELEYDKSTQRFDKRKV